MCYILDKKHFTMKKVKKILISQPRPQTERNPYYDMELTSGKMCDEVPAREGEIRAVVCGNRDVEVGELLHIKRGNEEIAIRVTGTFSPDEWIYGKLGKVSIDSSLLFISKGPNSIVLFT